MHAQWTSGLSDTHWIIDCYYTNAYFSDCFLAQDKQTVFGTSKVSLAAELVVVVGMSFTMLLAHVLLGNLIIAVFKYVRLIFYLRERKNTERGISSFKETCCRPWYTFRDFDPYPIRLFWGFV